MKNTRIESQNYEMVWASLLVDHPEAKTQLWQLEFQTRHVRITIDCQMMMHIAPAGQWVIGLFQGNESSLTIKQIMPLQGLTGDEHKQLIAFHFDHVPTEHRAIVRNLWCFYASIKNPILKEFFFQILKDKLFISVFFNVKGSQQHHCIPPGGLLAHCYEIAFNAEALARRFGLSDTTRSITYIGGLLHGISEIALYYYQPLDLADCGEADLLNCMLLKSQLQWLKTQSPRYFEAIVGCLKNNPHPAQPSYMAETIVAMVDRLATEVYHSKQIHQKSPKHDWYKSDPASHRRIQGFDEV